MSLEKKVPKVLSPTKQSFLTKRIFGFDIETYDNNTKFLMASIVGYDYVHRSKYVKEFYSVNDLLDELKSNKIFRNSLIFATNLSFDFFGTFFDTDEMSNFYTLFRSSGLLFAQSQFYKDKFYPFKKIKTKTLKTITFIDTLNFASLSVAKMGEILKMPKLETPSFIGDYPANEEEWEEMIKYNIRDSEISLNFMKFLIDALEELGATFKKTLASSSMSLFRNVFLDTKYYQPSEEALLEQFKSYYGGRTEAFERGRFKNYNYYDFNSLYPSVMRDFEYPDPNTLRYSYLDTDEYIMKYEGISDVEIELPYMKYPVLPVRNPDGRVIFPYGMIKGWYTHIELRYAVQCGAIIRKVKKSQFFLTKCTPFKEYVDTLYNLRLKYKKEKSPMEYVVKICMNSLYGKFGQRFLDRDNWVHEGTLTIDDLNNQAYERKGSFIRIIKPYSPPAPYCIPIWASYVTAYGRIKLHKAIVQCKPIYVDTDSLVTVNTFKDSSVLGELKKEMGVKEAIIVRPKFYALLSHENEEYTKIKGLGLRLNLLEFKWFLKEPICYYEKFTKFKESLRRNLIPNEIIETHKELSLEDEKRIWIGKFNINKGYDSEPIKI